MCGLFLTQVQLKRQGADMAKLERYISQLTDERGGVDSCVLENIVKDIERSSRMKYAMKQAGLQTCLLASEFDRSTEGPDVQYKVKKTCEALLRSTIPVTLSIILVRQRLWEICECCENFVRRKAGTTPAQT